MYDLIDRPVRDLPAFERTLLGRVRRWCHAFTLAGAAGVEEGGALGEAMHALDEGSHEDLIIQRPCFATVEETEALLLSLWRMVRDGQVAAARGLAGALVGDSREARLRALIARAIAEG